MKTLTIKKLLFGLATVLLIAAPSFAGPIYAGANDGNLYTLNPTTGGLTLIGSTGLPMLDIALQPGGNLYGVSVNLQNGMSELYSINPANGASTLIGSSGAIVNALVFGPDGTLYGAGTNKFYQLNPGTGAATQVGSTGSYFSAGDLEFLNGTLYLSSVTLGQGSLSNNQLYTINPGTGVGTATASDLGFPQVLGLAADAGVLYGVSHGSNSNSVITINPATGAGTFQALFSNPTGFLIFGLAAEPAAANGVPEPSTWGLMAAGLAAVMGISRRR